MSAPHPTLQRKTLSLTQAGQRRGVSRERIRQLLQEGKLAEAGWGREGRLVYQDEVDRLELPGQGWRLGRGKRAQV